jgi:hypothetical protein
MLYHSLEYPSDIALEPLFEKLLRFIDFPLLYEGHSKDNKAQNCVIVMAAFHGRNLLETSPSADFSDGIAPDGINGIHGPHCEYFPIVLRPSQSK